MTVPAQPRRLAEAGAIDRARPLRFRFGGRDYVGYQGDTLASALVANGVRLVGRSFKYHRPRGLIAAGVEEPNALVQLGERARSTPNVRATEVELYDGLVARPVNCWPSVDFDFGGINDRLSRFLAAGFYYKTFMWPNWRLYEHWIRRAAGLGVAPSEADPDRYESRFTHCDILVVGSGPAGLAAAKAAAASDARILLVEQDFRLGGTLLYDDAEIDGVDGREWVEQSLGQLHAALNVRLLTKTTAAGYFDHNALSLIERVGDERQCAADPAIPRFRRWQVRAKRVILATGAIERPLVFSGNDRPGIMLASAIRQYLVRFGARAGERALIFTNNDAAYATVSALVDAGVEVAGVVDVRAKVRPDLARQLEKRSVPLFPASQIIDTKGRKSLRSAQLRNADGSNWWVDCDLIAMSGGYNPTVHLFAQSGGDLRYDEQLACFAPDKSVQAEESVGAAGGTFPLAAALGEGHEAGLRAASAIGCPASIPAPCVKPVTEDDAILARWYVKGGKNKAFVDFQNDVSVADLALAGRESFISVEHLKRYTTLGMAPDQGKTSNVNALALMALLTGQAIEQVGTTRYRFPYTPVPLGAFAARNRDDLFRPIRRLPVHDCHAALDARFEEYSGWQRPSAYPRPGESEEQAKQREALAVRNAAGLFDGSPLGKIEVVGPDAGRFLDLIYANSMSTLKTGRVRYGLMVNELGVIIDDGVAARLGPDAFIVFTSSAGADRIAAWMEEWLQCEWPELKVLVAPVTTAWAVLTLTGPAAREILGCVGTDIDVSTTAFPHMTVRSGTIAGIRARVLRVSYTGETSFEINVPTSHASDLWNCLMRAGEAKGIAPIGIEAWDLLRTEKGYLHVGSDTDGNTTPLDIGWNHVLKKDCDFIGKRSLLLPDNRRADRLQFVGLRAIDDNVALPVGAHVVTTNQAGKKESDGHISSAGYSPTLQRNVALAMIRNGGGRLGEIVNVQTMRGAQRARVVVTAAYDPTNERISG